MLEGKRIAVFDAEIKKPIEECSKGWQSHDEMGVSVLVVFDYVMGRYRVFDDRSAQEAAAVLAGYDLVVGFNTVGFDWKLLLASWPKEFAVGQTARVSRDYDILREIWISLDLDPDHFNPKTHGGYKLDDVAFETIGMRKSGDGAAAPRLYKDGDWARLADYCVEDVRIEKSLFEFVVRYGYVVRHGRRIQLTHPLQ